VNVIFSELAAEDDGNGLSKTESMALTMHTSTSSVPVV
jgi:hypothetical protein